MQTSDLLSLESVTVSFPSSNSVHSKYTFSSMTCGAVDVLTLGFYMTVESGSI